MNVALIIPLVGQLLDLGLKIADVIEKAENVSDDDKAAMKDIVNKAHDRVTYQTEPFGSKKSIINEDNTENVRDKN